MKMMPNTHFLNYKDCPYTWQGRNLTEMRRSELGKIARVFDIDANLTKNEMLTQLMGKLRLMSAELELTDMIQKTPEPEPKEKVRKRSRSPKSD